MSRPARGEWIEIPERGYLPLKTTGLAPRGASGLKSRHLSADEIAQCLAPRGASGLKFPGIHGGMPVHWSRPARGEWIEKREQGRMGAGSNGLAPQGASGLKNEYGYPLYKQVLRLAPQGASGLKNHIRM